MTVDDAIKLKTGDEVIVSETGDVALLMGDAKRFGDFVVFDAVTRTDGATQLDNEAVE